MSWLDHPAYLLIDGTGFLVGILALLVGGFVLPRITGPRWKSVIRLGMILGFLLVVISAAPIPHVFYLVWAVLALILITQPRWSATRPGKAICLGSYALIAVIMIVTETAYWFPGRVRLDPARPVYVIGDSITAGITKRGITLWPDLLRQKTGLTCINLALPGATLESALAQQTKGIQGKHHTVILEIGGNDLLGDTDDDAFAANLETLVKALEGPLVTPVMFELPLYPFRNRIGMIQRRIAAEHRIYLIPRRILLAVIRHDANTVDGLHLSQLGQEALAEKIQEFIDIGPR